MNGNGWNPGRYPKRGEGAKEGLEKKLKYFANKDFQYEFGVSIGMCIQVAIKEGKDDADIVGRAFHYFVKLLEAKQDERFINAFLDYYDNKLSIDDKVNGKVERA